MKKIKIKNKVFEVQENITAKLWEKNGKSIIYFNNTNLSSRNPASSPGSFNLATDKFLINSALGKFWSVTETGIYHRVDGAIIAIER